jgi:hypothetical protein
MTQMQTQKPSVRIEGWAVVPSLNTASYEELEPGNLLVGKVFGHPRISHGMLIFTSAILSIDAEKGIVETKNTSYRLGEASREYDAWVREQTTGEAA